MLSVYLAQHHATKLTWHLNGLDHQVLHWPNATRPIILLLHGWMDCAHSFQAVVDVLAPNYDIFALNWRGMGGSAWQASGYYERMVMLQDLHQCLDRISPDKPIHVCGHSMGSMLATHYAALFPHRLMSLTMAEGFGMPQMEDEAALQAKMRRFIQTPTPAAVHDLKSVDLVTQKLQMRNPNMTAEFAHYMAMKLTYEQDGCVYYRADPKHHLPQAHSYDWHRIKPLWHLLTMPILWLQGQPYPHNHYLSRVAPILEARKRLLPNLKQCITLDSGHMLQWEAPTAFAQALDNFLGQIQTESVQ